MLKLRTKEVTKRMTVDIEEFLLSQVKQKAKHHGRTIREIIEAGLAGYLVENDKAVKKKK